MLEKVKLALRIMNTAFDPEIELLIASCKADLGLAGVNANKKVIIIDGETQTEITDPLIEQSILLYCKANFGYDDNAERFKNAYTNLKVALALSVEYGVSTDE